MNFDGGCKTFYREMPKSLNIDIVLRLELPSVGMVHELVEGTDLVLTAPAMGQSCVRIDAPAASEQSPVQNFDHTAERER